MTEHIHRPETPVEEVDVKISDARSGHQLAPAYVLAASILIGAILISGSVFYNTKIALQRLDGNSKNAVALANNDNQQTAPVPSQQAPNPTPTGPINVPSRAGEATIGQSSAKVTMVEFSDFQCPYCAKLYNDTFKTLKSKYIDTGKVRLVYRYYPLPFHNNAQKAAEAAECANHQGKFEQYFETLFTKGQSDGTGLAVTDLKKYAANLGLNTSKFNQCLDNGEAADAVKQDVAVANAIGVNGTPTFFLNGMETVGTVPVDTLEQSIEAALR